MGGGKLPAQGQGRRGEPGSLQPLGRRCSGVGPACTLCLSIRKGRNSWGPGSDEPSCPHHTLYPSLPHPWSVQWFSRGGGLSHLCSQALLPIRTALPWVLGSGGCPATLWLDVLGSGSPVHGGEKMLIGGDGRTERQEGSRRRTRFSHQTEVHRGGPCPQHWAPGCSRGTEGSQRKVAPEWEGSRRTGLGSPEEEGNPAASTG